MRRRSRATGQCAVAQTCIRDGSRTDYSTRRSPFQPVIECVPNVSDGRRQDVIEEMARAIRTSTGVKLLDCSSDRSHDRSVFTFVGEPPALEAAVLALYERAVDAIDLRTHRGVH